MGITKETRLATMKTKSSLIPLYVLIIALVALGTGFSDSILSNYFNDAYGITAQQRGFIEIPRETPGILASFAIASLAFLGDIRITVIAHLLACAGILTLGLTTPEFYMMTAVLFVYSLGTHIYLPLTDTIAMSICKDGDIGAAMGRFKAVTTACALVAAVIVFVGFRLDWLSFQRAVKLPFVFAAGFYFLAAMLSLVLLKRAKELHRKVERPKLKFNKKYKFYYILAIMNGVQKQIVLVYAPWVIIEILKRGADTTAILLMISSVCGIFFLPFLGKCIDRFGIKNMLYADALSFIGVYLAFAFVVYQLYTGQASITGFACYATFMVFIFDRMSSQMSIIRTIYLKRIAIDPSDILPTMSLGITMDHVVAITCSYFSGMIWMTFGPHVVFILAASLSLINLAVAKLVKLE